MHFVFDFDHTIYDTDKLWNYWLDALESAGIDRETAKEKGEEIFGIGFTMFDHTNRIGLDLQESEDLTSSFKDFTFLESPDLLYKDVIPFVESKSIDHDFSILTFGDPDYQNEKIVACGIGEYIDDVRVARPERLKIDHLKEIVQENENSVVFVDDNPKELLAAFEVKLPLSLYRMNRPNSRHANSPHELDGVAWRCISGFDEIEINDVS